MTAVMTTTRFWESEDSAESIDNNFPVFGPGPRLATNLNSGKELKISVTRGGNREPKNGVKKKSSKSLSRMNFLASPKRKLNNDQISGLELNGVKKSALLYEITERTNGLAKPKIIVNNSPTKQNSASSRISVSKFLSQRVSELSRPKTFYKPPAKPPGYVAPCALRAVATQRILELAAPRKTRSPRRSRLKNVYAVLNAPCSSRISYLARPKNSANCGGGLEARKNFLKRSLPVEINPPPWEFPSTRVWRELGYSESVVKRCDKECRMREKPRRKVKLIKPSRSNDSVFSFSVRKASKSRGHRRKKFRLKPNRRKRIKY